MKHPKKCSGFTLIEILITLGVVGLIMSLAISQVGKVFSREMKAQSRRLASTIRYLYNKSASEGVTLRLVFDFEENSYYVEATSDQFTLKKEEREVFKKKEKKDDDEEEEEGVIQPKEAQFSSEESRILKPVKLAKGVYLKDVYAEHQIDALSEGKAYIYFFSQGYVERSVINLRDKDDEKHFSLSVNPISGKVKIENKYKEMEVER